MRTFQLPSTHGRSQAVDVHWGGAGQGMETVDSLKFTLRPAYPDQYTSGSVRSFLKKSRLTAIRERPEKSGTLKGSLSLLG